MKTDIKIFKLVILGIVFSIISNACEKGSDQPQNEEPKIEDSIPVVTVDTLLPVAGFSYEVNLLDVVFTNTSENANISIWNFGDHSRTTRIENPEHAFPRTGTFSVMLIVQSEDKRRDTIVQEIEVIRNDGSINPNFTLESPYKNHDNWYRGQMHMHTNDTVNGVLVGSTDAQDSPTVMMETYRDKGYDFACITDHWVYTLDPQVEGIIFISGEEVEANLDGTGTHCNAFNITDTFPDGTLVEELVAVPDCFVQLNHPARSSVQFSNINNSGSGLWAIEIANWYNKKQYDLELWDNQISQGNRIWCNAGDDMHDAGGAGHNATMVNCEVETKEDIMKNLLVGNFYATEGGPDFVDLDIKVEDGTITCTTTNGNKILWYMHDLFLVKSTEGNTDSYTPVGNEIFVRVEVQMTDKDDDHDGNPNTAYSQPIFLIYE